MTIRFAILGLLSWRSCSGYDIKKLIAGSAAFYWSGNNNQIYRTLVRLQEEGLVAYQVQHQESLPTKKIFSITPGGLSELRKWVLSAPEPPEFRNAFLVQLAWADLLDPDELDHLLERYQEGVSIQLLMQEEKARRGEAQSGRTSREVYLWERISENVISFYRNELEWVQELRAGLLVIENSKE